MNRIALIAEGLRKSYTAGEQSVDAIRHVDVTLYSGQLTLLRGVSGSGKSTLLAILGGLLEPSVGKVISLDENIWNMSRAKRKAFIRQNCGYVFQTVGLFPQLTALQQIVGFLTLIGYSKKTATEHALHTLAEVGLSHKVDRKPKELSGGENQRVAIARMLAKGPKLIFCDEPTSALDRANGDAVMTLLKSAVEDRDAMVLCVTHDERLDAYADRILTIRDGVIESEQSC